MLAQNIALNERTKKLQSIYTMLMRKKFFQEQAADALKASEALEDSLREVNGQPSKPQNPRDSVSLYKLLLTKRFQASLQKEAQCIALSRQQAHLAQATAAAMSSTTPAATRQPPKRRASVHVPSTERLAQQEQEEKQTPREEEPPSKKARIS